jgi:AmmeMemoRadiSam system protein B
MSGIRRPAVAGQFYPGESQRLRAQVEGYLAGAATARQENGGRPPKAIIAPHAGYIYSGPVAGSAYAYLAAAGPAVRRVILLGPAHWAHTPGLAASSAEAFATPLGVVPVDRQAQEQVLALSQVRIADEAHVREHCLEVQLPFLQVIFDDFTLVPLAVGSAGPAEVAEVIEQLWDGDETVVVISSDLSHYHDYRTAVELDKATSKAIEALQPLSEGQACGRRAINGLLQLARQRGMVARTVDLRNSGDTAGPRDRVVGYGAYVFNETVAEEV